MPYKFYRVHCPLCKEVVFEDGFYAQVILDGYSLVVNTVVLRDNLVEICVFRSPSRVVMFRGQHACQAVTEIT